MSELKEIFITKIGVKTNCIYFGPSRNIEELIYYKNKTYKPAIDHDIVKKLLSGNKRYLNPLGLSLKTRQNKTEESLWLTLDPDQLNNGNPNGYKHNDISYFISHFFIINDAFEIEKERNWPDEDEEADTDDAASSVSNNKTEFEFSIKELYQQLRDAHFEFDKISSIPEAIQHCELKPKLTAYQTKAVKWMLNREQTIDYYPSQFMEIFPRWPSRTTSERFYYNIHEAQITPHEPDHIIIPSGGILADEMGLGKTVEVLSLILLNKRKMTNDVYDNDDDKSDQSPAKRRRIQSQLKCFCTQTHLKQIITCTKCIQWQHIKCVLKYSNDSTTKENYICPDCWQFERPIKSAATFIVSPASIKMQWCDEVKKHINNDEIKILVYDGIGKSGWISPIDLATYDIVLTDYKTLGTELNYGNAQKSTKTLRRPSRFLNPISPLLSINWWRVCLDEAQMVESTVTRPSQMVSELITVHRWAVTGTPIQKSINDLYGLMCFLNISPYDRRHTWNELTNEFQYKNNSKRLVSVLRPIMWRTCKASDIMEQAQIPEQTEIVHYVTLSDLETFFYNSEHSNCLQAFRDNTQKMEMRIKLSQFGPHSIKLIMEPLRKLRQDCTVPSIFTKNNQLTMKKCLKPDDLLKHLVGNIEIKGKSELRTICSTLNGMAGLCIIQKNNAEAIKMYKSVLRWAKDYTGNICVDSLLQIHALHNLLSINSNLDEEETNEFQNDLKRLEQKFIQTNANLVEKFKSEQLKCSRDIEQLERQFARNDYEWWLDVLMKDKKDDIRINHLTNRIQIEIRNQYSHVDVAFTNVDGIALLLTMWLDKLNEERINVKESFDGLSFFHDNLRPLCEIDEPTKEKVEKLIKNAFDCHLDSTYERREKKLRKNPKLCKLCVVKAQLETYECVIFDKKFVQHKLLDAEVTQGTWKAAYQECILRLLFSFTRVTSLDEGVRKDGKIHLKLLDALKLEFKELSQLWVEINHSVSAYDEINMCKSRLRAVDPTEIENQSKMDSKLCISKYEVGDALTKMKQELELAELEFVRKLGRLKYLNHLKKNKTVEVCPICRQQPTEKYVVLECGHHMCLICNISWLKTHGIFFECFICRHRQLRKNMYYVTLNSSDNLTDSSSKIEEIVKTIVALIKEDDKVKIVLFSNWCTPLDALKDALMANNIKFRNQLKNFHLTISEFKNPDLNVTCLLLPLSYGSNGLNLVEATHVFLIDSILNPGEELQAIGRVHRIGQTRPTFVHRFIVRNTIEEPIYEQTLKHKTGKWSSKDYTIENLLKLFQFKNADSDGDTINIAS